MASLVERVCEQCGNPLNRQKRFCSHKCSGLARRIRVQRTCQQCGEVFGVVPSRIKSGDGKFCSRSCKGKWRSAHWVGENAPNWKGGKITLICQQCGAAIEVKPHIVKDGGGKFCSCPCHNAWMAENQAGENSVHWRGGLLIQICQRCGKLFEIRSIKRGRGKFCSRVCSDKARQRYGPSNPNWKGGRKFEPYGIEFNAALKGEIRERDGYNCSICGKGKSKQCHHINYDKKDHRPENLVTLCRKCHGKTNTDRDYWQAYFTGEGYEVMLGAC